MADEQPKTNPRKQAEQVKIDKLWSVLDSTKTKIGKKPNARNNSKGTKGTERYDCRIFADGNLVLSVGFDQKGSGSTSYDVLFQLKSKIKISNKESVLGLYLKSKLNEDMFSSSVNVKNGNQRGRGSPREGVEGYFDVKGFDLGAGWEQRDDWGAKVSQWYDDFCTKLGLISFTDQEVRNFNQNTIKGEELDRYITQITTKTNAQSKGSGKKQGEETNDLTDEITKLLESNYQVILTGAPGTGKTYTAKEVAMALSGDEWVETEGKWKFGRIASVQFHPGYDYSDFVIGMKPVLLDKNGKELEMEGGEYVFAKTRKPVNNIGNTQVSFRWKNGVFKDFANKAKTAFDAWVATNGHKPEDAPKFVFLIDEINRADLSRVFGELFSLLEEEYRYPNGKGTDSILLPNGDRFSIPKNLYIIGTMNDIDRSVESMDFALRRRFAWKEIKASDSQSIIDAKVTKRDADSLKKAMDAVNKLIAPKEKSDDGTKDLRLGPEYQLGGAIFAKLEKYVGKDKDGNPEDADAKGYKDLWDNHIENILREYLRGRSKRDEELDALKQAYRTFLPNDFGGAKYWDPPPEGGGGGDAGN